MMALKTCFKKTILFCASFSVAEIDGGGINFGKHQRDDEGLTYEELG